MEDMKYSKCISRKSLRRCKKMLKLLKADKRGHDKRVLCFLKIKSMMKEYMRIVKELKPIIAKHYAMDLYIDLAQGIENPHEILLNAMNIFTLFFTEFYNFCLTMKLLDFQSLEAFVKGKKYCRKCKKRQLIDLGDRIVDSIIKFPIWFFEFCNYVRVFE